MEDNMSKSLRSIIFLLFVFAFLVTAPLLVLYTAGYRFDVAHGRIVHTAVLSIASTPRNATVLVDETTYTDRTPAVIDTILPGEHLVRLEKTGYLPWETSLSFESREARVMGPISLFLDTQPELQEVLPGMIVSAHSESNRFAYVSQESSWLEVWLVDISLEEKKLLMRLPFDAREQYSLTWSTHGTYILLEQIHDSQSDLYVTRVADGVAQELPVEVTNSQSYWWDLERDDVIYVRTKAGLVRANVQSGSAEILDIEADLVTTYNNQNIILSQSNNRAVISSHDGTTASIITYLPLGNYELVTAPKGLLGLHDEQRNRFVLIDLEKRDQPILLNEEVNLWKWSADDNTLLFSSGYDLKRYIRSIHETQTITRLSKPITHLDWYPSGSTILYQSDGAIEALNTDGTTILSQTHLGDGFSGMFWVDQEGENIHLIQYTQNVWEWWTRALLN